MSPEIPLTIIFYPFFDKKANSTKLPLVTETHDTFNCKLIDDTSVLNPVVVIENTDPNLDRIKNYVYAYIGMYNRYYFVNDVTSHKGMWVISLTVDVLGTYRNSIRSSSQYVLRSSVAWDQDIVDGIYPTIVRDYVSDGDGSYSNAYEESTLEADNNGLYTIYRKAGMISGAQWSVDRTYFKQGFNSGGFIVGLVSNNGTGVTYYAMVRSSLVTFLQKILTLAPSDITDVSNGYAKTIFNAIQYVVSVRWFPAIPTIAGGVSPETTINIAGYGVDVTGLSIYNIAQNYIESFYFNLDLPMHPQRNSETYGPMPYLQLQPYTQYNLYFAPFGNIPLDGSKLLYCTSVRIEWTIDFTTGATILKLFRGDYGTQLFYTGTSQLGVVLPVSSLTVHDLSGLATVSSYLAVKDVKNNIKSTGLYQKAKGFFEGWANKVIDYIDKRTFGWVGNITDQTYRDVVESAPDTNAVIDFGVDAVASCLGHLQTVGKPDSFLAYSEIPILYAWFLGFAEPDFERFGRPYNKKVSRLSTLNGGFCKCADSNVDFSNAASLPTLPERNKVNAMLNDGVFLE